MTRHIQAALAAIFLACAFGGHAGAQNLEGKDSSMGISSNGKEYPLLDKGENKSGSVAGIVGSGEKSEGNEDAAEFARLLAVPAVSGQPGVEIIIGQDDRVRVAETTRYPERAQVLVVLPNGRCSGTLVGKNLVLTAGHCVHSGAGGSWMASATIYPGRNGSSSPFGSCQAKMFYSVVGWVRDGNTNYDIGAIKLNCDAGTRVGWLGYWWQSASLVGKPARISGYPGDKPLEQWTHTDAVRSQAGGKVVYLTDTKPGNSGSGVFAESGVPAGCGGPCVHSVHTSGDAQNNRNLGTRLTKPLFDNLVRWNAE